MVAALLLCVVGVAALVACDALKLPALGARRPRLPFAVASTAVSSESSVEVSGLNVEDLFVDSPTEVHDKLL